MKQNASRMIKCQHMLLNLYDYYNGDIERFISVFNEVEKHAEKLVDEVLNEIVTEIINES